MKKIGLFLICLLMIQNICLAKDIIEFTFPEGGWHKVMSPDGKETKQCYVPYNQTGEKYSQMITFYERLLQNQDISASAILQKQLGKDRNNYRDIIPQYITRDTEDTMAAWCSETGNICTIERAFKGNEGIIMVIYTNKTPHYSQNMFGRWSNILSTVKLYNPDTENKASEIIEL